MSTNSKNLVKIGPAFFRHSVKNANFCRIVPKVTICHLVISRVTGPNFINSATNVVINNIDIGISILQCVSEHHHAE